MFTSIYLIRFLSFRYQCLFLLPSECHVGVKFSMPSFLRMCPWNLRFLFLLANISFFVDAIVLKNSLFRKDCWENRILSLLFTAPSDYLTILIIAGGGWRLIDSCSSQGYQGKDNVTDWVTIRTLDNGSIFRTRNLPYPHAPLKFYSFFSKLWFFSNKNEKRGFGKFNTYRACCRQERKRRVVNELPYEIVDRTGIR